jgi:hypothetical protein
MGKVLNFFALIMNTLCFFQEKDKVTKELWLAI